MGIVILIGLLGMTGYTLTAYSYSEMIDLWQSGPQWQDNPKNAAPVWYNWFRSKDLPTTITRNSQPPNDVVTKTVKREDDLTEVTIKLPFDYTAEAFPKAIAVKITSTYQSKQPFVTMSWRTPDGRKVPIAEQGVGKSATFNLSQNSELRERLGGLRPEIGLLTKQGADPETAKLLKGQYELVVEGLLFEQDATLDAKLIVYGKVHGIAGTDHQRRDLALGLLMGTPFALAFGIGGAVGATVFTFIIGAIGAWFGGLVDALIQRLTEINIVLNPLVVLILVGTFISSSLWVMLAVLIAISIFSAGVKTYRALFLQVREDPYIQAAQSYGAGNWRIVWRYMMPRAAPTLLPIFVGAIPGFIFLEATLAQLGLGDPVLPTWGKIISTAQSEGAIYQGLYYWVLLPGMLLLLTGTSFVMIGLALDRIFNPRLRVE
ncbi:MAG: ABC transporter permease [Candidatus Bipolaricaulia bacterium]